MHVITQVSCDHMTISPLFQLLQHFTDPVVGQCAADQFAVLLCDEPDVLTQQCRAVVKVGAACSDAHGSHCFCECWQRSAHTGDESALHMCV